MRRVVSSAAVIASLVVLAAGAQQPESQEPSTPIFRAGTTYVSVDVFPRRDGQVVEGLTAEDFEVFEDGQPQTIEAFQFIRIEPNPLDADRRDPNNVADAERQARDPANRLFVVYLDFAHTTIEGSHYARQPVLDFLNRTIGSTDLFAVMTAEVPVGQLTFARRTDTLDAELRDYWPWGQAGRLTTLPRTPQEKWLLECAGAELELAERVLLPLWREDQLMTSLENLMVRLGGLRDERKNILFASEGWIPKGPNTQLQHLNLSRGALPGVGVGPGGRIGIGGTMQPFDRDAATCESEVRRLASIDFDRRFRDLLTKAQQANVTFYPVDVGGLRTSATRATDTLRTLAENTDGFAIVSTNDLAGGVRRITDDLAAFYLLGYYSTNPSADGRYRRIEVRVRQADVDISARRGYLAPTAALLAAASAGGAAAGPSAIDDALAVLSNSRPDADLFVAGAAHASNLHVAVELGTTPAARELVGTGAVIRATALGPGSAEASGETVLEDQATAAVIDIPLPAGWEEGTWQVSVTVGPRGLQLDGGVAVAASNARLVGSPVAWRALPSPRAPLRPLASSVLTRRERLRVEWPVLADIDQHTARLLDRNGQPLGQPLPLTAPTADSRSLALDLPLGSLPEGDYVIELQATAGAVSEQRLFAFRVAR
jgi:VWFA-related protein